VRIFDRAGIETCCVASRTVQSESVRISDLRDWSATVPGCDRQKEDASGTLALQSLTKLHRKTSFCYSHHMRRPYFCGLSLLFFLSLFTIDINAQGWNAKLDKSVRFYQTTDLGVMLVGTEKSLYAIDAQSGETLWRRKDVSLDETDVAAVPASDLLLLSFEKGEQTRLEAVDIMTGDNIWRSNKLRGAVMQLAVDPDANLLAVVLAKDARAHADDGFKRHPLLHVLELTSGKEIWKNEISEVEMMPSRWPSNGGDEVDFTFDNYHPPVFLDDRIYTFYDGLTSFDARSGKSRLREQYKVNEGGLALTEAAPIFNDNTIYSSGRGHVRAISRQTGDTEWEAKDLGLTPEMILVGQVLYVRTGGQFTRFKDGDTVEPGPMA